jgi:protein SCO1/2
VRASLGATVGIVAVWWLAGAPVRGEDGHDHAAHLRQLAQPRYARSEATYQIPDATLIDQDGRSFALREATASGAPVALNFIFTTCTTICPVMTGTFAGMQRELGAEAQALRIVSISIDPEHDTPAALKAYAARHGATGDWRFLTGTPDAVGRVLKAFDAFAANKADHRPLTFFRPAGESRWIRIEGLASGRDLAAEYRRGISR